MPTEKDVSEKILEDHNDVFADIITLWKSRFWSRNRCGG